MFGCQFYRKAIANMHGRGGADRVQSGPITMMNMISNQKMEAWCCGRHTVTVWQTTVWILNITQNWNISFVKFCMKLDSFSFLVRCFSVTCLWHSWTLDIPVQWATLAILWKIILKLQPFDQLSVQVFCCSAVAVPQGRSLSHLWKSLFTKCHITECIWATDIVIKLTIYTGEWN